MVVTKIYSGMEPLTNSFFDLPILLLSAGTGNHYFLILVSNEGTYKLDWGPKRNGTNQGEVRLSKYNNFKRKIKYLGSTLTSIENIYKKAIMQWSNQNYNVIRNNCIKFAISICNTYGLKFEHSQLQSKIFKNKKNKSLIPIKIAALISVIIFVVI